MGTTTNFDWPYPELGDASNVPLRIQQLAEAADTTVATVAIAPVADIASLPVTGEPGQRIYVEDIDTLAWWDQKTAAWQGFARAYSPAVAGTSGEDVSNTSYLIEPSGMVEVNFNILFTAAASATIVMDLPAGIDLHADEQTTSHALGFVALKDASGANNRQIALALSSGATAVFFACNATATTTVNVGVGGAGPWTWASGDSISGKLRYRRLGS